ncbi:MAG: Crp/Fnr family transcriptional regulator [Gemmatimonadaceae bacterium]|nr:Crp/Fnr family transcriptional regulator [Gemmatimonadaceae bacterium]NUQ94916.1 Crp/Fnr family transcriptional regulator [Gemmatimonadaceae bacterium]NUR20383.1 Crp/Fnr family transcriptional regulator [Gemmatimonadaceae bacterium]NUS98862.1 Crp/Fnr family transcriptional regulator [Gemmatimonadaceae bacterium]
MDTRALLEQIPLFSRFSDEVRARLAARCLTRTYGAGHVLFTTGEPCRGLYIVESGRVRIYRTSPAGREQVLHTEGPGRPVAELPLFDGGPYPASAVTEVESRLVFLPGADFEALYRENPDVAEAVIRELGKRLRHLVHVTETLAFRDVAARLASFLAEYAEQHGVATAAGTEIVLDRTREELSQELGTARESVSRALKQLTQKGLIRTLARRRVLIPDVARLRTLGRPGARARYD